jgi:flagellar hook protein FlgE
MALLNSLFAGVSGLRNHQAMMDVIGNNIANVNTIGFKGSRVTFSDTFNQFVKAGTNPTDTSGGTNSFQVGLGMKINSIDRNWNQGTFERTGITTDLALQGPGMFVLESNGETFYSRAGAFTFDATGKLVNAQNGAIVQGKVANDSGVVPPGNNLEDIVVDTNLKIPAVATSTINWGGNLKNDSDLTRSELVTVRGNLQHTAYDALNPTVDTTVNSIYNDMGEEFKLELTYTQVADNQYNVSYSVYSDDDPTTILASGDFEDAGSPGTPATITFVDDGSGTFVLDAASAALFDGANNLISASSIGTPAGNLNFTYDIANVTNNASTSTMGASADGNREPNVVSGSVTVFDSLGTSHQVTLQFTKLSDNGTWAWAASIPGTSTYNGVDVVQSGQLTFNADGTLDPANIIPAQPKLPFTPSGGANVMDVSLDFGSGFAGVTQTNSSSVVSALSQDGSASASLSNLNIDQYGNIEGIFTNGDSRTLAQIMVATFPNLNGLISQGDNLYSAYANAGDPRIGELGEETSTTVQSGALEQSNVDLSEEFTKMIVSQRGFQANARVITTADTLLQEITNLIR